VQRERGANWNREHLSVQRAYQVEHPSVSAPSVVPEPPEALVNAQR
jgi:hypothetical protein